MQTNCYFQTKKETSKSVLKLLQDLKLKENKDVDVLYIRMDNAGENKKIPEELRGSKLVANFEFTAPNTPQQNGVIERKFPRGSYY